jgi:tetratricopeptide (TPR) repeat protein
VAPYDDFKHLLRERRFREAVAFAEAQAFSAAESPTFWLNQQAIALLHWGRAAEAEKIAEQALARDPSAVYSLLIRSEAQLKYGAAASALAGFQEAAHHSVVLARARKGILDSLLALRRFEEALIQISGWELDAEVAYPSRVKALGGLGRFADAAAVCREWLGVSPDNRRALWLLCEIEYRMDGIEATLAKYEKLAKIPSRPPIYGELCAMLYRKSGDAQRAAGQYDRLAGKSGDPAIARRRAFALAKSGRESEALPLLEELLRSDPADRYVSNAYVAAARRVRCLDAAWKFYHELLARFPDQKQLYGRIRKIGKEIEAAAPETESGEKP